MDVSKWRMITAACVFALTACKSEDPVGNGQYVENVAAAAGKSRWFSMDIPSAGSAIGVEVSPHPGLAVKIVSPQGLTVRDCLPGVPCVLSVSQGGRYRIGLTSASGFSGVGMSAAWINQNGKGSLAFDHTLELPALSAGGSSLQTLVLSGNDDVTSLDVGLPDAGVATLDLLDVEGRLQNRCQTGELCSIVPASPGVHFLRHHSPAGASRMSVKWVPGLIDLQGVWVVTKASIEWSFFRDLMIQFVNSIALFISNPLAAAEAFKIEIGRWHEDWRNQFTEDNLGLIAAVSKMLSQLSLSSIDDIRAIQEKLASLPTVLTSEESPPCTVARNRSSYLEFLHESGQYRVIHGLTGEGEERTSSGCKWLERPLDERMMSGPTPRQVPAGHIERFFKSEEGGITVHLEGKDRFSFTMDGGLAPGSIATMSRLVCAAANLSAAMFHKVTSFEGGLTLRATVPDPTGSQSGVTVSAGFDLGARDEQDLQQLDFPPDLIELLKPYLGLKQQEAATFLANHPLSISSEQAELIHDRSRMQSLTGLVADYARDAKGKDFCSIPERWQTVISSVQFQYGSSRLRTPNFWRAVSEQRWSDAVNILRNFNDRYPTRRNLEADYVQSSQ